MRRAEITFMCHCLEILGASTSWSPKGLVQASSVIASPFLSNTKKCTVQKRNGCCIMKWFHIQKTQLLVSACVTGSPLLSGPNRKEGWVGQRRKRGKHGKQFFLTDFEIQRKENMKDGRRKEERKKEVPSCTRNQTQNLQVGSVPLLLAF